MKVQYIKLLISFAILSCLLISNQISIYANDTSRLDFAMHNNDFSTGLNNALGQPNVPGLNQANNQDRAELANRAFSNVSGNDFSSQNNNLLSQFNTSNTGALPGSNSTCSGITSLWSWAGTLSMGSTFTHTGDPINGNPAGTVFTVSADPSASSTRIYVDTAGFTFLVNSSTPDDFSIMGDDFSSNGANASSNTMLDVIDKP